MASVGPSKSSIFSIAHDDTKMVKTAIRFMVNDLDAERAAVAFGKRGDTQPETQAVYGFANESIWGDPSVSQVVLTHVVTKGQPVNLQDVRREQRFGCRASNHPSVLCVPLHDLTGAPVGFLYADHSVPGKLGTNSKKALLQIASDFEQRRVQIQKDSNRGPEEVKPLPYHYLGIGGLTLAAVAFLVYRFL